MSQNKNIELLAPCGTIESFHAAIDAGANAVYLGMGDFNARQRQKNFTPETLAYLIPAAQAQGVKVYVTMNTLVKDGEMPLFIRDCAALKQLKPDALIVQDIGMIRILRKHFPSLAIHGSTQMGIHNSAGFAMAQELGLTRVVPSRELTLSEIRKINNKTTLEIELFVHGALCYSISGLCLASSFLGGASGNRGRCTQVCRRRFSETPTKGGFYFSPKDFCAIDFVEEYRNIGISSLKIEGRMKGSEYVYGVTSAYREYLDGNIDLETAKERLSHDFGRQKCTFLLNGEESVGIVSAGRAAGTGNYAGRIMGMNGKEVILDDSGEIPQVGDRVRFHTVEGLEGGTAKVEQVFVQKDSEMTRLLLSETVKIFDEGSLFIISRNDSRIKQWRNRKIKVAPRKLKAGRGIPAGKIMADLDHTIKSSTKRQLFLRGDSVEWLRLFKSHHHATYILSLNTSMENLNFVAEKLEKVVPHLICALPAFIPETKRSFWKSCVNSLREQGVRSFMIANLADKDLCEPSDRLYTDSPVWALNRSAQKLLLESGFAGFSYSPEDDILNLKRIGSDMGLFPLFMRVPLFTSRIRSLVKDHHVVVDSKGEEFLSESRDNISYLLSANALGLTHRVDKLMGVGIHKFVIDFSWYRPDITLFRNLIAHYDKKTRVPGSVLGNHKGGLK